MLSGQCDHSNVIFSYFKSPLTYPTFGLSLGHSHKHPSLLSLCFELTTFWLPAQFLNSYTTAAFMYNSYIYKTCIRLQLFSCVRIELAKKVGIFVLFPVLTWKGELAYRPALDIRQNLKMMGYTFSFLQEGVNSKRHNNESLIQIALPDRLR